MSLNNLPALAMQLIFYYAQKGVNLSLNKLPAEQVGVLRDQNPAEQVGVLRDQNPAEQVGVQFMGVFDGLGLQRRAHTSPWCWSLVAARRSKDELYFTILQLTLINNTLISKE